MLVGEAAHAQVHAVLVFHAVLEHVELQRADHADDHVLKAAVGDFWKIWMAPSCAICSTPLTNCLRFIVSLGETSMKCSGSNVGMPEKRNFLPGVVIVSPMEKMPGARTRR